MTKVNAINNSKGPARTWSKKNGKNASPRRPVGSKELKRHIRDFEAAMAPKKQQGALSKQTQDYQSSPQQTKSLDEPDQRLDEPDQRDDISDGAVGSEGPYPGGRQQDAWAHRGRYGKMEEPAPDQPANLDKADCDWGQDDLDPNDGYGERTEMVEPLPPPELRVGDGVEPSDFRASDQQPRVDFKRYQDIIDKITVNSNLQNDSKDVNIKFTDETLDGAQVVITKSGDKVKVRWMTNSGSVYRLLTKQRFQLQQHLYGHLGIRSDVSVDFKKEAKPRFARPKKASRSTRFQKQKS
jgi:hypothetical protein